MNPFIILGIALIVGVVGGKIMNKLKVPAVAGYIIGGLLLGVSGLNIITGDSINQMAFLSDFALCIIAFNIGSELELSVIKQLGKSIFIIAFFEAFGAFLMVTIASFLITKDVAISLILGSVSAATAPAATVMVLREQNAKGPLTSTLLGVVAVDDAICLVIYAMAAAVAKVFVNNEVLSINKVLLLPISEIIFSLVVGAIIGLLLTVLIQYSKRDNELLPFIIGSLLLLDGLATAFSLSPLLSAMAMGIIVANTSPQKIKAFTILENFAPPIVAAFFILAGARLNFSYIPQIGILGVAYLLFRILGKVSGASLGASISKAPQAVKKYIGLGLLSQVGVAVGLAITVNREFPNSDIGTIVVTILLATTIVTEIVGPISTKFAISKSGEGNS
ncbi:cation:proton antiporter [Fusibacter bizertensis]|uniref:Cation:proton antiporter n=1 Tax=Fusibacter bizertensis TaxID=1488331 RepID=A0ABT6NBS4_9FIRM|nr:cation:proton antiporter [Fusibacter bizertensis]MDH8677868.1 cation:proton antiporter [Fusibacter bizertensis]